MTVAIVDIVIVGAGPYGLSLAAHLKDSGRSARIFGSPMGFWSKHMPHGMHLKSEGFASCLYDPRSTFTLETYCAENSIPYRHIGLPVALATFIAYGLEFQRRFVPHLENAHITSVRQSSGVFELTATTGEVLRARRIVVAVGINDFAFLPSSLVGVPAEMRSHSSQHSDLGGFRNKKVAVLGAGASALDIAALLLKAGADVDLVARRSEIKFHDAPKEPRSIVERLKEPRSGLGIGWRSRMCTDIPLVFHTMPESFRLQVVERHLGPAPCWFLREEIVGRLPMHLSSTITGATLNGDRVRLVLAQPDNRHSQLDVDHVIAATGYKVAVSNLKFLDETLRTRINVVADSPILNRQFESSVEGLYFAGAAAANSFGPLLRFAYGAKFTAARLAKHLARN